MKTLIWHEHNTYSEEQLATDLLRLPSWRREQALQYKFFAGRRDCCLSYLLLCQALQEQYGIQDKPSFVIGEHGKPSLREYPHVHFNLSHCSHAIACVVSSSPVGIDVESTDRRVSDALIRHTMSPEEQALIRQEPLHFFRLWTQKEALVKLCGTGLQDNLHHLLSPENLLGINLHSTDYLQHGFVLSVAIRN